jgi:fatty acid desaturase
MADETKQRIERAIERVQRRYEGHGRVFQIAWVLAAVVVVLAGLAMTVFPGPAIVVIPVGLAMLAAVFEWARRLLTLSMDGGLDAKRRLDQVSRTTKLLAGAVLLVVIVVIVTMMLR